MNGFYNSGFNYNNYPAYSVQNQDERIWIANEQAIKALYPKEYAQICAKIKELQSEKEA